MTDDPDLLDQLRDETRRPVPPPEEPAGEGHRRLQEATDALWTTGDESDNPS